MRMGILGCALKWMNAVGWLKMTCSRVSTTKVGKRVGYLCWFWSGWKKRQRGGRPSSGRRWFKVDAGADVVLAPAAAASPLLCDDVHCVCEVHLKE